MDLPISTREPALLESTDTESALYLDHQLKLAQFQLEITQLQLHKTSLVQDLIQLQSQKTQLERDLLHLRLAQQDQLQQLQQYPQRNASYPQTLPQQTGLLIGDSNWLVQ
ncbi:hypothetical protein BGX34_008496, partial [Mortierella sp. NVP85]